jgi:ribosomal protein S18 acetylase RimI-like enzyme
MIFNTSKGSFIIREAWLEDIEQLVHIHVTSWNATYPDYHPKPSPQLRRMQWEKAFNDREDNWFCFVAQKEVGEVVGFATGSDYNDEPDFDAQLNKIHFLKDYQRLGLGRLLVGHVVNKFIERGYNSMLLFADADNTNIEFYDMLLGERLIDKSGNFHGAFGWRDLQRLKELCFKQLDK